MSYNHNCNIKENITLPYDINEKYNRYAYIKYTDTSYKDRFGFKLSKPLCYTPQKESNNRETIVRSYVKPFYC